MGQNHSINDFQLVAECSTELENLLKNDFGAHGTGLGELCSSASIPQPTKTHISYVRKERNKKLHADTCIDREEFIRNFTAARDGLRALAAIRAKRSTNHGRETSQSLSGAVRLALFKDDSEAFHYHIAVQECDGELSQFTELVGVIDASTCDPTATMMMELCEESITREALSAAEYAYRCGFTGVGDMLASRMIGAPKFDKALASSVELVEDAEKFPFIAAVDESEGDVEECKQFLELVDEQDYALDATIQADVVRGIRHSVQWTAVEYACHLGYIDVVKYMLKETVFKDSMPMKTKFQMLKSVRERSVHVGTSKNSVTSV
jgi:hypothetical protein